MLRRPRYPGIVTPRAPLTTDIVLLGAGHAHVEVLRRHAMRPTPGVRLTLIAREAQTPYSGMLPGLIRGEYGYEQAHIDCAPLAAAAGARLILAPATAIDLKAARVAIDGRPGTGFDLLSVDVGGEPNMPEPKMPAAGDIPVKPIGRFLDRLAELEAKLPPGARVAVVGAGAGGTELALALASRLAGRAAIALVCPEAEPIAGAPPRARRPIRAALAAAGVELLCGVTAVSHSEGRLALSDGRDVAVTAVLWATDVIAPRFLAQSGLACDAAGCILVDATLRSVSHPAVFAAGDCATLRGDPRPKAGVWAVRAGKPLFANLVRAAARRPLVCWRPQRAALVILGVGHGRAVAWRGSLAFSGRLAWLWKDHIDRRWIETYQRLRPMPMHPNDARCGGCGAKLGAAALAQALAGLGTAPRADIPLGLDAPDDAAVTVPPPGMAVLQSVDHFRAFIDDPFVFGQIAAAHALSDIYAMGARPWTALAVASVPFMHGRKMAEDLTAMMRGAALVLEADGCALIGGHSAEAAETALGFAVTGLAAPEAIWRKSGLVAGQALVLTKPLGTGIILAAHMRGLAKAAWLQSAIASMRRGNADASRILRAHGVASCTDVTGYGLAGHLSEMLRASGLSACIDLQTIPVLPGSRELADKGIASTLAEANRREAGLPDDVASALLVDPQTSGGLLAGVPAERTTACLAALHAAGLHAAAIGWLEPPGDRLIRLRKPGEGKQGCAQAGSHL